MSKTMAEKRAEMQALLKGSKVKTSVTQASSDVAPTPPVAVSSASGQGSQVPSPTGATVGEENGVRPSGDHVSETQALKRPQATSVAEQQSLLASSQTHRHNSRSAVASGQSPEETQEETQEEVQNCINKIYSILNNNFIKDRKKKEYAMYFYQALRKFIEDVSQSRGRELNAASQIQLKELWNDNIIINLRSLSTPQSRSMALSESVLESQGVSNEVLVNALCHYLGVIKSVFVQQSGTPLYGQRANEEYAGGEKKKAIRKTKRKSTSVKSKPSRKYKKRSVSTKK